jgi:hypothetical protein
MRTQSYFIQITGGKGPKKKPELLGEREARAFREKRRKQIQF